MRTPQVPLYHLKTYLSLLMLHAVASACVKGMWNFTCGPCFELTRLQTCSWLATALSQIRDSLKTGVDYRPDVIKKKKKHHQPKIREQLHLAGFGISERKHERHLFSTEHHLTILKGSHRTLAATP